MEKNDPTKIVEEIIHRIRNITGNRKPISRELEIYHDLQIAGDDAFELLDGLHKAHGTNLNVFNLINVFQTGQKLYDFTSNPVSAFKIARVDRSPLVI